MRTIILASLLAVAAGCGASQKTTANTDPAFVHRATTFQEQRQPQPLNVSRSTESGPSGAAGVGPNSQ